MSDMGLAYRLSGLRHRYGDRLVLDVPALDVARGETLAVIGPSGAGKTTLLRLLQFLERPSEGRIEYEGTPTVVPMPIETTRTVSTVFQRSLMLDRTVRENVAFGRRLRRGLDLAEVDALLERLALKPLANTNARSLSGGEMQRVALARAIATGARVLLLDEPAANLDPRNVAIVEAMIKELQGRNTTLVLVTHNTHEARRLASRTLVLIDGQVVEVGPTAVVFDSPDNPRTRAFLSGELVY